MLLDERVTLACLEEFPIVEASEVDLAPTRELEPFRVLFRERGILSFFHAGKMTTHRAKIPRFCCGYFRPCVPLLGPGGPVFNVGGWRGSAGDGVV